MGKTELFLLMEAQLKTYVPTMAKAAEVITDENVSNYPIFAAHQGELSIGLPLIEKEKHGGQWNINASTLEEFVAKNIIFSEKVDEFRENYKSPDEFVCIFVLSELGATFNYLPIK
ncbi:MAG TPA: hypothetical protein PKD85_00370 [Saprospiraceae bacterium]|nr:hypothetical protein [Saprospiraceae bacterium]